MSNVRSIESGSIVKIGEILEPERAARLGSSLMAFSTGHPFGLGNILNIRMSDAAESSFKDEANYVALGGEDAEAYGVAHQKACALIRDAIGVGCNDAIRGDVYIGTANRGKWHIDPRDFRLLVNISPGPISLKVATEWDNNPLYHTDQPSPAAHVAISYDTGEGVVIDNLCDLSERTPHAGVVQEERLFLRFFGREQI